MNWVVDGADAASGKERSVSVEAADREAALAAARSQGVLASGVRAAQVPLNDQARASGPTVGSIARGTGRAVKTVGDAFWSMLCSGFEMLIVLAMLGCFIRGCWNFDRGKPEGELLDAVYVVAGGVLLVAAILLHIADHMKAGLRSNPARRDDRAEDH